MISRIRAWLANPVELEWDQSPDWCELAGRRALGVLSKWASILAFRTAPLGLMLFAIGFLVIGRIPGGGGPIPWRVQIIFAAPLLVSLLLPYLAIRTGLVKVRRGEGLRASLRTRTLEVIGTRGVVKRTAWTSFEAFDFGVCEGFPVLKLRVRDKWPFRGHRPTMVVALHVGDSHVQTSAIRQVLGRRGLHEEPLGEPTC